MTDDQFLREVAALGLSPDEQAARLAERMVAMIRAAGLDPLLMYEAFSNADQLVDQYDRRLAALIKGAGLSVSVEAVRARVRRLLAN